MKQDSKTKRGARPVILCLSSRGHELALKLRKTLDADIHGHATRCPKASSRSPAPPRTSPIFFAAGARS